MKKSVNVSIAGIAFVLDAEAYKLLKDYTVKIELGYRENPDGAEILSDIEARIAELILSRQSAETMVTEPLIREVIDQLGLPDDLKTVSETEIEGTPEPQDESIPHRLYRNPDGAKLGGVCSGLAAYFAVEPVMVRLAFVAPLLLLPISGILFPFAAGFLGTLFGVSFMLYFILWFAIPKAKTPRQKLEMQGKKVTASSIHNTLHEEINTIAPSPKSERSASVLAEFIYVLGRIALFCIKAVAILIAFGLIIGVIALIVGTVTASAWFFSNDSVGIFSGINDGILVILAGLLVTLPMIVIGYLLFQLVFGLHTQRTALSIIGGIWLLVLIFVSVLAVRNYETLRDSNRRGEIKEWFNPRLRNRNHWRKQRPAIVISDSVSVEKISVGDSVQMNDTIRREIFME